MLYIICLFIKNKMAKFFMVYIFLFLFIFLYFVFINTYTNFIISLKANIRCRITNTASVS